VALGCPTEKGLLRGVSMRRWWGTRVCGVWRRHRPLTCSSAPCMERNFGWRETTAQGVS